MKSEDNVAREASAAVATPTPRAIAGSALEVLPDESLADVVTYADHLVRVRAELGVESELTQEERTVGEGLTQQPVQFRVVEVLWSREGAPPSPESIAYSVPGHTWADGKEGPRLQVNGQPLIDAGSEYIVPIAKLVKGGFVSRAGWAPLTGASVLAADDLQREQLPGWAQQAEASSVGELVSALRSAVPHAAANLAEPDPRTRWELANRG